MVFEVCSLLGSEYVAKIFWRGNIYQISVLSQAYLNLGNLGYFSNKETNDVVHKYSGNISHASFAPDILHDNVRVSGEGST